jgi:hypothetical protein
MSSPTVITTTHDEQGLSVFQSNPTFKQFSDKVGVIYSTATNGPVVLTNNKDLADHEARDASALIPKEGSVVLVAEWPPGTEPRMHRTLSVDVGVMLAGESMFHPVPPLSLPIREESESYSRGCLLVCWLSK